MRKQLGQTLIETIVAIFILTTALTAGLALTIFVFSHSQQSLNEIVAVNLARQGIEIIRMARDSNWLGHDARAGSSTTAAYRLQACADIGDAMCFPHAYRPVGGNNASYTNPFDLITPDHPNCNYNSPNCTSNAKVYLDFGEEFAAWPGFNMYDVGYTDLGFNLELLPDNSEFGPGHYITPVSEDAVINFSRKITFTRINQPPFTNQNNNWKIIVRSYVVWKDKNCPDVVDIDPEELDTSCKVVLEEHLTNWKDYK